MDNIKQTLDKKPDKTKYELKPYNHINALNDYINMLEKIIIREIPEKRRKEKVYQEIPTKS
jgi:hypothetical protein